MLFKTNIFPLVRCLDGRVNSNRVQIWDDNKHCMVGELSNRHEVRGIVLRRDVIVMVCEYSIYMYTTDVLRLILHIATSCNIKGLCALSPKDATWVLCCPGQRVGSFGTEGGSFLVHFAAPWVQPVGGAVHLCHKYAKATVKT